MGFLTDAEPGANPNVPTNPNLKEPEYQGVAVDTRYIPRKSLTTHIGGYRWVIDYFSQVIGNDDETAAQEVNRPEVYQQYLRIRELEVKVQDPLTASQDNISREFSYKGSAVLYAGTVPNKGDMFIADIGDGRNGLFVVDDVEQLSIFRDTNYNMEYSLKSYLTKELHQDLLDKVVKTTYFHKDFLAQGSNPLLVEEEHHIVQSLHEHLARLPGEYLMQFFDKEHSTLTIPGQDLDTYDPFLMKYINSLLSLDDHSLVMQLRELNVQDGVNDQMQTFWDAFKLKQPRIADIAENKMVLFVANQGYQVTSFASFRTAELPYLYFPANAQTTMANEIGNGKTIKATPIPNNIHNIDVFAPLPVGDLPGVPGDPIATTQLIKPILVDEYYILSEAFYKGSVEEMSVLELLAWYAVRDKTIPLVPLNLLLEQYHYWPKLEAFYYLPILIFVMRSTFKDIN